MTKITTTEFFTRAIQTVPFRDRFNPEFFHLGIRADVLRRPFARYYGTEVSFDEALDSLVREKTIVAVHLIWGGMGRFQARKITELERLESFPDRLVADTNPILYLPQALPKSFEARLNRTDDILNKILEPTLLVANC